VLVLPFCNIALLTFTFIVPNPFLTTEWPHAMQCWFENFIDFFVLFAGAVLHYSWHTVLTMGAWTNAVWIAAVVAASFVARDHPELTAAVTVAFGDDLGLAFMLDPNSAQFPFRVQ